MTLYLKDYENMQLNQAAFESAVLEIWHEAHGDDSSKISSTWGQQRIGVMIENVLFKAEQMLARSEAGSEVVEKYVQRLMQDALEDNLAKLSELGGREIEAVRVKISPEERCLMAIFRLEQNLKGN